MMIHSNTIALALLSTVCALPVLSQDQNRSDTCDGGPPQSESDPQMRTRLRLVEGPDGKRTAVRTPVREMKVAKLIFVGTPAIPLPEQEQIAKSLTERETDDDQVGLDELVERARDAWQAQGFFKAGSELGGVQTLEESPERRTVAITLKIDAGKQYRLEGIQFASGSSPTTGQPHLAEDQFSPEQLRVSFPINAGEIFDTHKLQTGLEELRKAYGRKGYINFVALPTFNIDDTRDTITLALEIQEGKQFRIGKIQVLGPNPQLAETLINDSGLTPGSVFDASLLDNLKLSKKFRPEDDVERRLDENLGTVDLKITLRDCP